MARPKKTTEQSATQEYAKDLRSKAADLRIEAERMIEESKTMLRAAQILDKDAGNMTGATWVSNVTQDAA